MNISQIKTPIITAIISIGLAISPVALAVDYSIQTGEDGQPQQTEAEYVGEIIVNVLNIALGIVAVVALLAILWGGFTLATAAGKEARAHLGRKLLLAGSIVLFVDVMSWIILVWTTNNIIERIVQGG